MLASFAIMTCLMVELAANSWVGSIASRFQFSLNNEGGSPIKDVVKGLMFGPLDGRAVTLVLSEEEDEIPIRLDELIKDAENPLSLLRLPSQVPTKMLQQINNTLSPDLLSRKNSDSDYFPLQSSVVMILIGSEGPSWWPLWIPPESWIAKSIVVLASSSCSKEHYLETPLLQRPSSLALLCLSSGKVNIASRMPFNVWTWMPFVGSDGTFLDLGTWDSDSFRSWNHLFVDRFTDMSTKNMTVLCSTEDSPLVYKTSEGAIKGSNYFILELLSKWLRFKTIYKAEEYMSWAVLENSVRTGESDVFINYATITPERYAKFDITVPYHREGFGIILELPPPLPRWRSILYPFNWIVWGLTVLSLICTSVVFHILNYKQEKSLVTNTIIVLQDKEVETQPLSLSHLQGPFFLYFVGLFSALLLMLWEVLFPLTDDRDDSVHSLNFS